MVPICSPGMWGGHGRRWRSCPSYCWWRWRWWPRHLSAPLPGCLVCSAFAPSSPTPGPAHTVLSVQTVSCRGLWAPCAGRPLARLFIKSWTPTLLNLVVLITKLSVTCCHLSFICVCPVGWLEEVALVS